jgi:ribosomal protein S18 acetylase RimI-like enzyme
MAEDYEIRSGAARAIPSAAVRTLYDEAGWWPERELADIEAVTRRGPAVGAWRRDELVGFACAVVDGRFRAYVEDVVVAAAHRGRGLGTRLVDALLADLAGVDTVSLFCEETLVGAYERSGFRATRQRVLHRKREHPRPSE